MSKRFKIIISVLIAMIVVALTINFVLGQIGLGGQSLRVNSLNKGFGLVVQMFKQFEENMPCSDRHLFIIHGSC